MAIILRQWIDLDQCFEAHCSLPVVAELVLVQAGPRSNECQCSPRQASPDHPQRLQLDACLVLTLLSMEVGRRVIRAVEPDRDPVEGAYARHGTESIAVGAGWGVRRDGRKEGFASLPRKEGRIVHQNCPPAPQAASDDRRRSTDHEKRDRHSLHVDDNRATKMGWGRVRAARGRDLSCSTGGVNML